MSTRPRCAESLAVLLDAGSGGTPDPDALRRAEAHAATCPQCADALDDGDAPRRIQARFTQRFDRAPRALLVPLITLSGLQLVVALPWLFGRNPLGIVGHASSDHLVRDGAIGVVIAIAGLIASYDATRARTLCLVCTAALVLQLAAGFLDEHERHVSFDFELTHLLAVAIVILLALIAHAVPYGPTRFRRRPQLRPLRERQTPH